MFLPTLIFVTALAKYSYALCIPCPSEDITLASFSECDCQLGYFYEKKLGKCVEYSECPPLPYRNPLDELRKLAPTFYDALSNSIESAIPEKIQWPRDVELTSQIISKRLEVIKRQMPGLVAPIVAPVLMKNKNILNDCKGKAFCILIEALKKQDNYTELMPKLKPLLMSIYDELLKIFEDLDHVSGECNYTDNCPIVRAVVDLKSSMPEYMNTLQNIQDVVTEFVRYIFSDVQKYLPLLKIN